MTETILIKAKPAELPPVAAQVALLDLAVDKRQQRLIDGARHYAAWDKSDPFCLARCMLHIRQGIAGLLPNGEDAIYSADPQLEERLTVDGKPYHITVYRNVKRP
jgi:hypothetical protein